MIRRPLTVTLPVLLGVLLGLGALPALLGAAGALADATTTVPASEAPAPPAATTTVPAPTPPPSESTSQTTTATTEVTTVPASEVQTQRAQPRTVAHAPHIHTEASGRGASQSTQAASHTNAVPPSTLTPPLPSTLGGSISGVPSFFIDSFTIPPFLLPIYQAAGAAYGIPWQVLAAINEVETDYGRDLSVSSAGAEGWMQFLPSTWGQYGVDVNNDGFQDPYNPADAIFAAARYLQAAGGQRDIRAAVFAYNHSQTYVNSVMLRARLLGGTPPELLGAITGLTEARFPVYAPSHYGDGFPSTEGASPRTVAGTTIYSQAGAPVIAAQDGRIVQIGQSGPLGRAISLRDAYGNTYIYSELGALATLYPVLEGPESFSLHPLRVGVQVIAGTVLGHVGSGAQPHIVFQIRPAGIGAPLIDPKPILDGWVKLRTASAVRAKGRDPFTTISPTAGQALLESKTQLQRQIPRDAGIRLASCERRRIGDGQVDRRVLAALEFLSASGLKPTVSARSCSRTAPVGRGAAPREDAGDAVDISAVNGIPVAGPNGSASLATAAVRKLLGLQGAMKPLLLASSARIAGTAATVSLPGYAGLIHLAFTPLGGGNARLAGVFGPGLSPRQWIKLVARLGEIPDPAVSAKPSPASIPDHPNAPVPVAGEGS